MTVPLRQNTDKRTWEDWKWQQKNTVRDVRDVKDYFKNIPETFFEQLHRQSGEQLKFQITPYMLSQIPGGITQSEMEKNPWFLQFFPRGEIYSHGYDAYDGTDNWENPEEFPTRILQHKYTNRALIRFRTCLAYCSFCFEALATLEKDPAEEKRFYWADWQKSVAYLSDNQSIEEVIFSGGEPLFNSNSVIEGMLKDVSEIKTEDDQPKIRFKRIHTRVLTHNPYRIDCGFVDLLRKYRVNEIAFDVAHPSEITKEFEEAIDKIKESAGQYAPLLAAHIPLLKGINDDPDILWELFAKLYDSTIKPYYLLHAMPHTPYADRFRTSVRKGVILMNQLKRHKSNIAVPEFIIVHREGKHTVPREENGTPEFQYTQNEEGHPVIRFKNWKGNWETYLDARF